MPAQPPAPQPPAPAPAPAPAPPSSATADDRISSLEAEQQRQGGLLEQILERLPGPGRGGGGQAPAPAGGPSVAEQVRDGIRTLEAERAAAAETDASKQAREDHAARIKALEERTPTEAAGTPVGRFRGAVQKVFYGIEDGRR